MARDFMKLPLEKGELRKVPDGAHDVDDFVTRTRHRGPIRDGNPGVSEGERQKITHFSRVMVKDDES
jgi:hypothetical protein